MFLKISWSSSCWELPYVLTWLVAVVCPGTSEQTEKAPFSCLFRCFRTYNSWFLRSFCLFQCSRTYNSWLLSSFCLFRCSRTYNSWFLSSMELLTPDVSQIWSIPNWINPGWFFGLFSENWVRAKAWRYYRLIVVLVNFQKSCHCEYCQVIDRILFCFLTFQKSQCIVLILFLCWNQWIFS